MGVGGNAKVASPRRAVTAAPGAPEEPRHQRTALLAAGLGREEGSPTLSTIFNLASLPTAPLATLQKMPWGQTRRAVGYNQTLQGEQEPYANHADEWLCWVTEHKGSLL